MATRYVLKTKKDAKTQEILGLCNPNETWKSVSKEQAIADIEGGVHVYKVSWPEKVTDIKVVSPTHSAKYLRTDRDSTTRNNLLDLPDC